MQHSLKKIAGYRGGAIVESVGFNAISKYFLLSSDPTRVGWFISNVLSIHGRCTGTSLVYKTRGPFRALTCAVPWRFILWTVSKYLATRDEREKYERGRYHAQENGLNSICSQLFYLGVIGP